MSAEKPKSTEEKKEESKPEAKKEEAEKRNAAAVIIDDATHWLANWRQRRKLEQEGKKVPSGEKKEASEQQKKEASGALLGCKLGLLGLGGIIALALGGAIIGLQKLATADKWFMKGFNSVSPGGMKGGGGKKEKA